MLKRSLSLPPEDRILFLRRLSLFLRAGIPLHASLLLLSEDTTRSSTKDIVTSLAETILDGKKLSEGLEGFPKAFDPMVIGFIRTGEASGTLASHAAKGADLLHKRMMLRRSISSAAVYPAILLFATLGASSFLTLYAFPKMLPLFRGFHQALPFTTRTLIGINALISHHGWELLFWSVAFIAAYLYLQRYVWIREKQDNLLAIMPYFGKILRYYHAASVSRMIGTFLESGLPVLTALDMTVKNIEHALYTRALHEISTAIGEGRRLGDELSSRTWLFPRVLAQMVHAGELTGSLAASLHAGATICEDYLDERIRTLSVLIEPVLMIVMGLIVGFVALAIITPIYSLTQGLGSR